MDVLLNRRTLFITLIKREFLEHRMIFLSLPVLGTAVTMLLYAWLFVDAALSNEIPARIDPGLQSTWRSNPELYMRSLYGFPLGLMMTCYWLTMIFYFLTTLQQQRKNRSVMFWNSLPVSDTQTILSKLVAGLLCCQAIYVACYLVFALFLMLLTLGYGAYAGIGWDAMVTPAKLPGLFATVLANLPLNILWVLPVYGWCLLVSARVRQVPFLWAAAPIGLIILVETVAGGWLAPGQVRLGILGLVEMRSVLLEAVPLHAVPVAMLDGSPLAGDLSFSPDSYPWLELAGSALLGALFVFAAIRFNRVDDQ